MAEEKKEVAEDFELIDRQDEEQILDELRGTPVDKMIYKNSRGQFELSYIGTKWAVREMANRGEAIRIKGFPQIDRDLIDPEYITAMVIMERVKIDPDSRKEQVLDSLVHGSRRWIKQKLLDGRIIPDEHFYTKAISIATSGCMKALMPQDFKQEMIERLRAIQASGGGGGRGRGAPPAQKPQQRQAPPQQRQAPPSQPPQGAPAQEDQAAAPVAPPPKPAAAPARPPAPAAGKPAPAPVAGKPAAPAPAAGKPAAAPAAKPPAKPAAAAPGKPAVPNTTKASPGQSPRESGMDVLFQRFEIVLKQASGATDRPKMLAYLKALTGKDAVTALSREEIQELGPILNGISKGAYQLVEGTISDSVTGEILWPKQAEQFETPPEPQIEESAPAEEPLF